MSQERLTRNQDLVLTELVKSSAPLSAYDILDKLRGEGLRAPLQVYRALEKLQDLGKVHRIESINSFVACRDHKCCGDTTALFAICDSCGQVSEFTDPQLQRYVNAVASQSQFQVDRAAIELRGTCAACAG